MYVLLQPRLQSEGDDRLVVDTGFATLLMNYGNMLTAAEAVSVLDQLRSATKTFWGGDDQVHCACACISFVI